MTIEPQEQPPPGIPAPPPGPEAQRSRRWMKRILVLGIGSILLLLSALIAPLVLRSAKKSTQTQATSNARQLGMALFEFQSDYGHLPDASTIAPLKRETGSTWNFGTSTSNDFFKQLMVAGIAQSEEMFYAQVHGAKKPDNFYNTEATMLSRGECGFAYIPTALDSGDSSAPVAMTPIIPGTFKFDPKPFDSRAVVLRADNSVRSYVIASDGHVIMPGGKDLFDPSQPWWMGKAPSVIWPDLPAPFLPPTSDNTTWIIAIVVVAALTIPVVLTRRSSRRKITAHAEEETEPDIP